MDPTTGIGNFLNSVAATVIWVVVGAVLLYGGLRLLDRLDPIDYHAEIKQGNVAAAIVQAAYLIGLAYLIATIIRS